MRGVELVRMYEVFVREAREKIANHNGPPRRYLGHRLQILQRFLDEARDKVRAEKRLPRRQTDRQMRRLRRQMSGLGPVLLPRYHHNRVTRHTITHIWDEWYVGYVPEDPQQELAFLTDMATRKRRGLEYLETGSSSEDEGLEDCDDDSDSSWSVKNSRSFFYFLYKFFSRFFLL